METGSEPFPTRLPLFLPRTDLPRDGAVIFVIGPAGSGKTSVIWNLLPAMADRVDHGYIFCKTKQGFEKVFPSSFIKSATQAEVDRRAAFIMQTQEAESNLEDVYGKRMRRAMMLFDDAGHLKQTWQTTRHEAPAFSELLINRRHWKTFILSGFQTTRQFTDTTLDYVNYVILTGLHKATELEAIRKDYFPEMSLRTFTNFCNFWIGRDWVPCYNAYGEKIWVMQKIIKDVDRDKIYQMRIVRSDCLPKFSIGDDKFWQMHYDMELGRENREKDPITDIQLKIQSRKNEMGGALQKKR